MCKEKLYTLLSLFFASPPIAALAVDEVGCPFRLMLDEHEESLVTQLLIETAVLIRMKDDLFQQQHGISAAANKDIVARCGYQRPRLLTLRFTFARHATRLSTPNS